jgi:hypothetical protein
LPGCGQGVGVGSGATVGIGAGVGGVGVGVITGRGAGVGVRATGGADTGIGVTVGGVGMTVAGEGVTSGVTGAGIGTTGIEGSTGTWMITGVGASSWSSSDTTRLPVAPKATKAARIAVKARTWSAQIIAVHTPPETLSRIASPLFIPAGKKSAATHNSSDSACM